MKYLLLTDYNFPCSHPILTGVYADRLTERGHEIIWVMRPKQNRETTVKKSWNGNPVYILPHAAYDPIKTATSIMINSVESHPIHSIVQRHSDIDFIQVRNDPAMSIVGLRLSERLNVPYIHRISHTKAEAVMHESINHSKPIISYFKGWLWKLIRNTVCRRADLIMSISESMSTYIGQHCDTRIESVPTGADERLNVRDIDPTEVYNSYNISPGSQIVIYIGSMAKIRKLEFLLKSFKEVQNKKDVQLIMLGGREYQNRNLLKSYAKELGVFENIQFTGWLSENKLINKFIKTADIGVSPIPPNITCFRTSSPIKTHEYLNLETPVVASTVPDQQHVIEQSNGGYIVPFETTAFADKIIKLLDSPHMIKRFGKNGAKYVKQNRSYDSIATKISNIYHKI